MRSSLIFFDNKENSKRGNLRGLVIFPIFIILTLVWRQLMTKYYKCNNVGKLRKIISLIISAVLIVSAIGVQTPNTLQKAVVYGALIGFVIYGVSNCVLLVSSNKWGYMISFVDTLWGIASTSLLSFILYKVVQKYPYIFKAV